MHQLVMQHVNIILNNGISRCLIEAISRSLNIPSGIPEQPTTADHRHLSHLGNNTVPSQYGYGATIIFPFKEYKIHHHQESSLFLRSSCIKALRSSHDFGAQLWLQGQWVVHHAYETETGDGVFIGWFHDGNDGGVRAAVYVMPVEAEMGKLFLL